ncbi:siderophore iron transporter mirB [Thozetella sp. PMI_491]|nr:siderophore iron transporter mirB [Thozetella sp. PMI_491]
MDEALEPQNSRSHSDAAVAKDTDIIIDSPERDPDGDSNSKHDDQGPTKGETQEGVQYMEAVASVWNKTSLVTAYVMMWIIYFLVLVEGTVIGTLTPFVTSTFGEHSLTPTVTVLASIVNGVSNLTLAKILDVWGRHVGIVIATLITELGFVIMAACRSIDQFAAADVFWQVGHASLLYTVQIIIADTSSLKSRGLMYAFAGSPSLITTWAAGPIAQAFLYGPGWAWAFGTFSIITPVVVLPLIILFFWNIHKAKTQGLLPKRDSKRTAFESVVHYCREFDAVGLVLLTAGLALFLLPFNIYTLQPDGWRSPLIICFLVFGFVLMVAFVVWERFFAPISFLPFSYLSDRQVLGACVLGFTLFLSQYCWKPFFSSYLMVVGNQSVTTATYITNAYQVGLTVFSLVTGWVLNRSGHYKYVSLFLGLPFTILALGLLYYFATPGWHYGYFILAQMFLSIGNAFIILCDEVAGMAAVSHQYVAVILAMEGLFSSIGGSIGSTLSAAIWTSVFPKALANHLPAKDLPNLQKIYGSVATQLTFPVGSDTRIAIENAYSDAQRTLLIPAMAVWILGISAVIAWRDVDLRKVQQVRGNVV